MATHTPASPLSSRIQTRQKPSGPASPAADGDVGNGVRSRNTTGTIAQRDRTVGDEAVLAPSAPLPTLPPTPAAWAAHDDARLIGYLVERYHRPLREELPRLQGLAALVATQNPEDAQHVRTARLIDDLALLLLEHLDEEEGALFPSIVAGEPVAGLAGAALDDHHVALRLLGELRDVCGTSAESPEAPCRALAHGLMTLERELVDHIVLETDVLWPRLRRTASAAQGPVATPET